MTDILARVRAAQELVVQMDAATGAAWDSVPPNDFMATTRAAEDARSAAHAAAIALIRDPGLVAELEEAGRLRKEIRIIIGDIEALNWEDASDEQISELQAKWWGYKKTAERAEAAEDALHKERMLTDEVVFKLQAAETKLAAMEADAGRYRRVYAAARGLCHGSDWNQGTQSNLHGYRQQLIDAVQAIDAAATKKE